MHVDGLRTHTAIESLRLLSTSDFQNLVTFWWSFKLSGSRHHLRIEALQEFVLWLMGPLVKSFLLRFDGLGEKGSVSLGDFTSIHKIPQRQRVSAALEKSSGTCQELKFPLWNVVFEKMLSKFKIFEKLEWGGLGLSMICEPSCLLGKTRSKFPLSQKRD